MPGLIVWCHRSRNFPRCEKLFYILSAGWQIGKKSESLFIRTFLIWKLYICKFIKSGLGSYSNRMHSIFSVLASGPTCNCKDTPIFEMSMLPKTGYSCRRADFFKLSRIFCYLIMISADGRSFNPWWPQVNGLVIQLPICIHKYIELYIWCSDQRAQNWLPTCGWSTNWINRSWPEVNGKNQWQFMQLDVNSRW